MFSIQINNVSTVKDIYFQGINPVLPEDKIEKNGFKSKNLGSASIVEFALYSKDSPNERKPANYEYIKINEPGDHVKIEITKHKNTNELRTVIEWLKKDKQKSNDYPPDNVNVGVKE